MAVPFLIIIARMARRKGRSQWFSLLGLIPVVNFFVTIWIASLPDAKLLEEIADLKRRL